MRLLDTDVCVEVLRGNPAVIERRATTRDEVATSCITAAELHYGAARSWDPPANAALVDRFLETLPVLNLDRAASRRFGRLKADLQRQNALLADADLLIAAIALATGATLVTGNQRHYERIEGLAIEDWIRG